MIASEASARSFCESYCSANAMAKLTHFVELLSAENKVQNLVSRDSLSHVWQRHIADSVQLVGHVPRETSPWLDMGSGAGLPGIPLAAALPNCEIVLVESRRRRANWLARVIRELALDNCRIIGSRLELVDSFPAAVITARAFAPLPKLLKLSERFSTHSTVWLLPKGRSGAQELAEQPKLVQSMFHVEQSRTDSEAAIIIGKGSPKIR